MHWLMRNPRTHRVVGGVDGAVAWSTLESARLNFGATTRTAVRLNKLDEALNSLAVRNADVWVQKEVDLYFDHNSEDFASATKFSLAADPAVRSNQETMVGVFYSWELDLAMFGLAQIVPQCTF